MAIYTRKQEEVKIIEKSSMQSFVLIRFQNRNTRLVMIEELVADNGLAEINEAIAALEPIAPKSPEHYLDQHFSFVGSSITFNVVVQSYDAEHDRFLLYDHEHPGSFYRKAEFIYEHCKPANEPVVRKVFPKFKIDKFRFLNLLSITDPEHPLYSKLKEDSES